MNPAEIKEIANQAADAAVQKTFTMLGIDITNADSIRTFQANQTWTYRFRRTSEKLGSVILITIAVAVTGGLGKLVWEALKTKGGTP